VALRWGSFKTVKPEERCLKLSKITWRHLWRPLWKINYRWPQLSLHAVFYILVINIYCDLELALFWTWPLINCHTCGLFYASLSLESLSLYNKGDTYSNISVKLKQFRCRHFPLYSRAAGKFVIFPSTNQNSRRSGKDYAGFSRSVFSALKPFLVAMAQVNFCRPWQNVCAL